MFANVVGFEDFEARLAEPSGFLLLHVPRDEHRFDTASGLVEFTVKPLQYVPQTNPPVSLGLLVDVSRTPTSKVGGGPAGTAGASAAL